MHSTQTFTMAGSALDAKQIYIAFMSFREQMQFALNKKLEHCTTTIINVYVPNQRAIQAVWLYIYCKCTTVVISSGSKRKSDFVRINTDVLASFSY